MNFSASGYLGCCEARILRDLGESGSSASLVVADHLNDVASNGVEQAGAEYLADQAESLAEEAMGAAAKLDGRKTAGDALQAANSIASVLKCGKFSPCDAIDEIEQLLIKAGVLEDGQVNLR